MTAAKSNAASSSVSCIACTPGTLGAHVRQWRPHPDSVVEHSLIDLHDNDPELFHTEYGASVVDGFTSNIATLATRSIGGAGTFDPVFRTVDKTRAAKVAMSLRRWVETGVYNKRDALRRPDLPKAPKEWFGLVGQRRTRAAKYTKIATGEGEGTRSIKRTMHNWLDMDKGIETLKDTLGVNPHVSVIEVGAVGLKLSAYGSDENGLAKPGQKGIAEHFPKQTLITVRRSITVLEWVGFFHDVTPTDGRPTARWIATYPPAGWPHEWLDGPLGRLRSGQS